MMDKQKILTQLELLALGRAELMSESELDIAELNSLYVLFRWHFKSSSNANQWFNRDRLIMPNADNSSLVTTLFTFGFLDYDSTFLPFSPTELKTKAQNGDKTAQDFLQTFVPYQDMEEVRKVFPEYVKLLEANNENGYYFYHCPKVTQGNRCPDYENRPQICRDFPDNPTAFLPPKCGFKDWKLKSNSVSLKLSAEMEISLFYIEKIKGLYK